MLTGIVLVGLFLIVNLYYFLPSFTQRAPEEFFDMQQIFDQDKEKKIVPAEPMDRFFFTVGTERGASITQGNYKVSAETSSFVDLPTKVSVVFTTPEPSPRTKEEIVAGLPQKDWIKRVEFKDVIIILNSEQRLQGVGFVQVAGDPVRLAVPATMMARFSSDKSELLLHIESEGGNAVAGVMLQNTSGQNVVKLKTDIRLKRLLANN